MSGLHGSSVDPPSRLRGFCYACASALCKMVKVLLHVAIVVIIFIFVVILGIGNKSFGSRIAYESVSSPCCHCLPVHLLVIEPAGRSGLFPEYLLAYLR
jgi:hypothetical protein